MGLKKKIGLKGRGRGTTGFYSLRESKRGSQTWLERFRILRNLIPYPSQWIHFSGSSFTYGGNYLSLLYLFVKFLYLVQIVFQFIILNKWVSFPISSVLSISIILVSSELLTPSGVLESSPIFWMDVNGRRVDTSQGNEKSSSKRLIWYLSISISIFSLHFVSLIEE